jgi:hypothetical protein
MPRLDFFEPLSLLPGSHRVVEEAPELKTPELAMVASSASVAWSCPTR